MTALVPLSEMESMARHIVASKLFGAKDIPQAMSLMLLAQAEGVHPMTAIQDFDIVQGRPARKTHSILARFQAAGGSVAWEEISGTRACGTFSHKSGGSVRVEWTIQQAQKVGLTGKDNWKNYPQAMLRARCIAEGVRAVYPGAIGGALSVEEAQDLPPVAIIPGKDMGAAEVVLSELGSKWVDAATRAETAEVLKEVWTTGVAEIKAAQDMPAYHAFKEAVEYKGKSLAVAAAENEEQA